MELLILIYGVAFIAIIYYMIGLRPIDTPLKKTDIQVVSTEPAWPWTLTQHSFWNHWFTNGSPNEEWTQKNSFKKHRLGGYGYTGRNNLGYLDRHGKPMYNRFDGYRW